MLDILTNLLPVKLRPYAKAIYPFLATIAAVVVEWVSTKSFNSTVLVTAIVGLVSTTLTFLVPNKPTPPSP